MRPSTISGAAKAVIATFRASGSTDAFHSVVGAVFPGER